MCRELGYAEIQKGRYRSVCRSFKTENNDETQPFTIDAMPLYAQNSLHKSV